MSMPRMGCQPLLPRQLLQPWLKLAMGTVQQAHRWAYAGATSTRLENTGAAFERLASDSTSYHTGEDFFGDILQCSEIRRGQQVEVCLSSACGT